MKQKVKVALLLIILAVIINVVFFASQYKKLQKNNEANIGTTNTEESING